MVLRSKSVSYRKAKSEYSITVELMPHELPPPANAIEKLTTALRDAAMWAPNLGDDLVAAINDLMHNAQRRANEVALATKEEAA